MNDMTPEQSSTAGQGAAAETRVSESHAQVASGPQDGRLCRAILDSVAEGVAVLNGEGVITYCNSSLVKLLETHVDSIVGVSFLQFAAETDCGSLIEQFSKDAGVSGRRELTLKTAGGTAVPVEASFGDISTESGRFTSIVISDLREVKRIEDKFRRTHEQLDEHVRLRTTELLRANAALLAEISGHKKTELQLRESQRALQQAHDELEMRVKERTEELFTANQTLLKEMAQRKRAEEAHSQVLMRLNEAQETERSRISRELHDEFGQDLTVLKLRAQMLGRTEGLPSSCNDSITLVEETVDRLMESIHRIASDLRPVVLDDFGLAMALERHCKDWGRQTAIRVEFFTRGMESTRLPAQVETTLYRVACEALANVARHAKASGASVLLERRSSHVSLIVEDNGQGFEVSEFTATPQAHGRLGLVGMRERLAMVGGEMELESVRGSGTTLFVRVPVPSGLDSTIPSI